MKKSISTKNGAFWCERDSSSWSYAIMWLNLFLSFLIVLLHTDMESSQKTYIAIKRIINTFSDVAVPAFFFVSAYLMFRSYGIDEYFAICAKKTLSLLLPYIVWNVVGYIYSILLSLTRGEAMPLFSFENLLLCKYNGPLWFLRTLYIYALISPAIYYLSKRKNLALAVIIAILVKNLFIPSAYSSALFWMPMYLLGAFLGLNYYTFLESDKIYNLRWIKRIPQFILPLFALTVAGGYLCGTGKVYYVYRMLGGILIVIFFWVLPWNKAPSSILRNSFITFCSHSLLLGVFKKIYIHIFGNDTLWVIVSYLLCAGSVWLSTIVFAEVVKKGFPWAYSVLAGGRKEKRR